MNAPLPPMLPGLVAAGMPGPNGLPPSARPLPPAPGLPGALPAAFANDLAQLLMASELPAGSAVALATGETVIEPSNDSDPTALTDAVTALWIELGIAAQPVQAVPPAPAQAGTTWQAAPDLATAPATPATTPVTAGQPPATELLAKIDAQPAANEAVQVDMPDPAVAPLFTLSEPPRVAPSPPGIVDVRLPQAPQQIAETVVWNIGKGLNEVQIRLNPEDLGPLDVHLKLDGDKVAVRFDTVDASVRDVVQTSLPQLSTLLSARGLQLDQAQVFQQDRGQAQPQPHHPPPHGKPRDGDDPGQGEPRPLPVVPRRRGLFDDWV